jgi:hypothetical protein
MVWQGCCNCGIPAIGFAPPERVCVLLRLNAILVDEGAGLGVIAGLDQVLALLKVLELGLE